MHVALIQEAGSLPMFFLALPAWVRARALAFAPSPPANPG
nr:MFS transporter [Pseudomonas sp. Kh13]